MKKSRQRTLLAAIVCAVLGVILVAEWWALRPMVRPPTERVEPLGSDNELALADQVPTYSVPQRQRFDNIVKDMLFRPERTPAGAPDQSQQAEANRTGAENLRVDAILLDGKRRAALLRAPQEGEYLWVNPGQRFRGWTVDEVFADGVRVTRGESAVDISLRPFRDGSDQGSHDAGNNE